MSPPLQGGGLNSLEEAALKRKARLASLKRQHAEVSATTTSEVIQDTAAAAAAVQGEEADLSPSAVRNKRPLEATEDKDSVPITFRNYEPIAPEFKELIVDKAPVGPEAKHKTVTVEGVVDEFTQEALDAEANRNKSELDLTNLAPKKVNWDLKRDVQRKLAYLDKKTSLAIVSLVRSRLKGGDISALAGHDMARAEIEEDEEDR